MNKIFMLVFAVGLASAYPGDVFRYADEDTKQSHYMEGEPGTRVSGGWAFESPEGKNYQLTYQADELGFQPQADYIPLQVEDTNEVVEAKTNFYQLYEEAKQKVAEAREDTEDEAGETTPAAVVEKEDNVEVVRTRRGDEDEKAEEVEAEKADATTEEAVKAEESADGEKARSNEEMMVEPDMKTAIKRVGNYFYFNQMNPGAVAQKKAAVNAPKLVFHPYYGYIPVAAEKKEGDMKAADPEKEPAKQLYVYNPYQGYIPVPQQKEGEKAEEKVEQKFEFHPYFGYIPVSNQKKVEMKANEEMREKYVFHPYYGFMPISQLKGAEKEMKENQKFYFDPYYGFIPVAAKTEEEKMEAAEEVAEKVEEMEEMIATKAEEMEVVEKVEEEMKEEMKEEMAEEMAANEKEPERFYFHPYYGFIPVSKLTDEKMRKQVNMEMKYVLHPYFGFIPESRLKAQEAKIQQKVVPYNPFGYKFLPYQPIAAAAPKNYHYTYNTIGDKMKAMTAKVEAKVDVKAAEEVDEMKREKRSAAEPVVYQVPASTYPLFSSPVVASPVLAKSNVEPDTKALLQEQMYQPQYVYSGLPQQQVGVPVTQVKANFAYQPYYYVPFQYAAAKVEAKQDDIVPNFPITPLGATVAQNALPEKDFPIFPYDPEQDKPAAVAF